MTEAIAARARSQPLPAAPCGGAAVL